MEVPRDSMVNNLMGGQTCTWSTFQSRLRHLMQDHQKAYERLAAELLEGAQSDTSCVIRNVVSMPESLRDGIELEHRQAALQSLPKHLSEQLRNSGAGGNYEATSPNKFLDKGSDRRSADAVLETVPPPSRPMGAGALMAPETMPQSIPLSPKQGERENRQHSGEFSRSMTQLLALESGMPSDRLGATFVGRTHLHLQNSTALQEVTAWIGKRVHFFATLGDKWAGIIEPKRTGLLASFVSHKMFDALCGSVILANTMYMVLVTNKHMLLMSTSPESQQGTSDAAVELAFFVFYVIELLIRLLVHKLYFFCNEDFAWNSLDCFLVVLATFEYAVNAAAGSMNFMFLRILRLLKVSKLLRVVRAVRFLAELRLFIDCLRGCAMSLFWALVMIFIVLLLFSLLFVQSLATHLQDDASNASGSRTAIIERFGSVEDAMITLLEIACGFGDWYSTYKVVSVTGGFTTTLFVFFTLFMAVAVWNIVTSVFLENTMKVTQPDREVELLIKHRQDVEDAKELMQVCQLADSDGSGTVSLTEFQEFMCNDAFRRYFDMRGIDIKDTELFFHMVTMSTGATEIDLEAFVGSCLRVKGSATSIDLHTLGFEMKIMNQIEKRFFMFAEQQFANLDEKISELRRLIHGETTSQASAAAVAPSRGAVAEAHQAGQDAAPDWQEEPDVPGSVPLT
eukprot:TRINITY_DN9067_c0_g3_i2.p1 TRINITY_DN9067_c0_g3~~TRINITY_DN9067_c0_g3_i2.p1  ORF type:complete len:681 (+),score=121.73 TRINITY_DN9067_c0_g3_i2:153-2195(+)